jgi:hypothetical protein
MMNGNSQNLNTKILSTQGITRSRCPLGLGELHRFFNPTRQVIISQGRHHPTQPPKRVPVPHHLQVTTDNAL